MATTLDDLAYFSVPIQKWHEDADGNLIVEGTVTDGTIDSDKQRVSPAWSREALKAWMASGPNVRVMHSKELYPAGRGLRVELGDTAHSLRALVVEDTAKKLVKHRVLTAFSIGVADPVVSRDPTGEAPGGIVEGGTLAEVSLVDRPANGNCRFTIAKSADRADTPWTVGDLAALLAEVEAREAAVVVKAKKKGKKAVVTDTGDDDEARPDDLAPEAGEREIPSQDSPVDGEDTPPDLAADTESDNDVDDESDDPGERAYKAARAAWQAAEPKPATALTGTPHDLAQRATLVKAWKEWDAHGDAHGFTTPNGTGHATWLAKRDIDPNVGGGVDRDQIPAEDFVDPKRRRFPIVTPDDIGDAVSLAGQADPPIPTAKFRARLMRIAHRKGDAFVAALPDSWDDSDSEDGGMVEKSFTTSEPLATGLVPYNLAGQKKPKRKRGQGGGKGKRPLLDTPDPDVESMAEPDLTKADGDTASCPGCGQEWDLTATAPKRCPGCGRKVKGLVVKAMAADIGDPGFLGKKAKYPGMWEHLWHWIGGGNSPYAGRKNPFRKGGPLSPKGRKRNPKPGSLADSARRGDAHVRRIQGRHQGLEENPPPPRHPGHPGGGIDASDKMPARRVKPPRGRKAKAVRDAQVEHLASRDMADRHTLLHGLGEQEHTDLARHMRVRGETRDERHTAMMAALHRRDQQEGPGWKEVAGREARDRRVVGGAKQTSHTRLSEERKQEMLRGRMSRARKEELLQRRLPRARKEEMLQEARARRRDRRVVEGATPISHPAGLPVSAPGLRGRRARDAQVERLTQASTGDRHWLIAGLGEQEHADLARHMGIKVNGKTRLERHEAMMDRLRRHADLTGQLRRHDQAEGLSHHEDDGPDALPSHTQEAMAARMAGHDLKEPGGDKGRFMRRLSESDSAQARGLLEGEDDAVVREVARHFGVKKLGRTRESRVDAIVAHLGRGGKARSRADVDAETARDVARQRKDLTASNRRETAARLAHAKREGRVGSWRMSDEDAQRWARSSRPAEQFDEFVSEALASEGRDSFDGTPDDKTRAMLRSLRRAKTPDHARAALAVHSTADLRRLARHYRVKPGKSRESAIDAIVSTGHAKPGAAPKPARAAVTDITPAHDRRVVEGAELTAGTGKIHVGTERQKLAKDLVRAYVGRDRPSVQQLADEHGISYGKAHRILTESGVQLRARGGGRRRRPASIRHARPKRRQPQMYYAGAQPTLTKAATQLDCPQCATPFTPTHAPKTCPQCAAPLRSIVAKAAGQLGIGEDMWRGVATGDLDKFLWSHGWLPLPNNPLFGRRGHQPTTPGLSTGGRGHRVPDAKLPKPTAVPKPRKAAAPKPPGHDAFGGRTRAQLAKDLKARQARYPKAGVLAAPPGAPAHDLARRLGEHDVAVVHRGDPDAMRRFHAEHNKRVAALHAAPPPRPPQAKPAPKPKAPPKPKPVPKPRATPRAKPVDTPTPKPAPRKPPAKKPPTPPKPRAPRATPAKAELPTPTPHHYERAPSADEIRSVRSAAMAEANVERDADLAQARLLPRRQRAAAIAAAQTRHARAIATAEREFDLAMVRLHPHPRPDDYGAIVMGLQPIPPLPPTPARKRRPPADKAGSADLAKARRMHDALCPAHPAASASGVLAAIDPAILDHAVLKAARAGDAAGIAHAATLRDNATALKTINPNLITAATRLAGQAPHPLDPHHGLLTEGAQASRPADNLDAGDPIVSGAIRAWYPMASAQAAANSMRALHDHLADTLPDACPLAPHPQSMPDRMRADAQPQPIHPPTLGKRGQALSRRDVARLVKAATQDATKTLNKRLAAQEAATREAIDKAHTLQAEIDRLGAQPDPAQAPLRGAVRRAAPLDTAGTTEDPTPPTVIEKAHHAAQADAAHYASLLAASPNPEHRRLAETALLGMEQLTP